MTSHIHDFVADIGGTNTRTALARDGVLLTDTVTRFRNADYPGLEAVLRAYLDDHPDITCDGICAAVAGPVRDGAGRLTNLGWHIDEAMLSRVTGAATAVVFNDLQAQGHGLHKLSTDALKPVISGATAPDGATQLVIGVGTGFNISPVYTTASGHLVPPSEMGYISLPAHTAKTPGLIENLTAKHGFPTAEEVVSGRGVEFLYEHCSGTRHTASEVMERLARGNDPAADATAQIFVETLGAIAGDLSLIHLPFGGVFLIGGVARAFSTYFDRFGFEDAFRQKGRFSEFMESFPVYVVEDDFAALSGCASHLSERRV